MNTSLKRGTLSPLPLFSLSVATWLTTIHPLSRVLFLKHTRHPVYPPSHLVIDLSKHQLVFHGVASTSQSCATLSSLPTFLSLLL